MKKTYYWFFCVYLLLVNTICFGQMNTEADEVPQMATGMRADGKIYVVIAVLVTILFGILFYLVNLDKKIGRLEKEVR